jgi:signal transduction histidine kinase
MRVNLKDAFAGAVAVLALASVVVAIGGPAVDPGIHLTYTDGQVVIASIDYGSAAYRDGLQPGLIVTQLDGTDVLRASDGVKRGIGNQGWSGWSGISVLKPEQLDLELMQAPVTTDQGYTYYSNSYAWSYWYGQGGSMHDLVPLGLGLLIFLVGWWWLAGGRGGAALRPFALTLPLAVSMPILILPLVNLPSFGATVAASLLLPAGMLPLGLDFASREPGRRTRWLGYVIALGFAAATVVVGLLTPLRNQAGGVVVVVGWAWLAACIVFVPGFAVARPIGWRNEPAGGDRPGTPAAELILPAITPGIACLSLIWVGELNYWPLLLWLLALQMRGLSFRGLLSRTARQRDLVVRATEAERARIAADIHDYALQDLTMLIRRLDAGGDTENAAATREVAERLRVICGDLRLPILDDLGVGPALEWICGRVDPAFGSVTLDRVDDERRPPSDVELAFFRVAQEAINNAVRHGAPPVRIRYRAGGNWAELEVDDRGAGVPADAAEQAERTGHLGMLNMTQRADAVDAELSIGRRPGGGTRVRLVWEGAAEPAADRPVSSEAPQPAVDRLAQNDAPEPA